MAKKYYDQNGNLVKKKGGCLKGIGIVALLLIAFAIFGPKSDETGTTTNSNESVAEVAEVAKTPEIEVTATEVIDAFSANEIRGNELYKDKYARITGTVESIAESFGSPYITMSTDSDEWSFTSLQILFESPEDEPLSSIEKGQLITVEGTIDGMSANIVVNDATIVE